MTSAELLTLIKNLPMLEHYRGKSRQADHSDWHEGLQTSDFAGGRKEHPAN